MASTNRKPKTIDEYLKGMKTDQRTALEKLRKTINAVAPKAEECISYEIAAFRLNGRLLVGFGGWLNHCAFYPMSSTSLTTFQKTSQRFRNQEGHDSLFNRQTATGGSGEEVGQSANC